MPRPGVDVNIVDEFIPGQAILDTGQSFMIGVTERGPVGMPVKVYTDKQFGDNFGGRSVDPFFRDSVSSFFNDGGGTLLMSRVAGDAAAASEGALGTTWDVTANGPGTWGDDVKVTVAAPGGTLRDAALLASGGGAAPMAVGDPIVLVVNYQGEDVERSPILRTQEDGISWAAAKSKYIRLAAGASTTLPAEDATVTLSGGADDDAWDAIAAEAALDVFTYALGPGQVSAPGHDDNETHQAIGRHCDKNHRVGLVDLPDTNDPLALASAVGSLYGVTGCRYLLACGSWLTYPYTTSPATVKIPYSGMQAGLIALADKAGDPSIAAAGADGISRYALGLTQIVSDDDRTELNELGVCLGKDVYGQIRTYGYRTAAGPDETNWLFFQESRVVMAIAHECDATMEEYVFKTIDGHNHLFAKVNTALTAVCQRYYLANALFGDTPEEAFRVDTGAGINTIDTIKAGEVHAQVLLKTSKLAEWIVVNLIKKPIESAF